MKRYTEVVLVLLFALIGCHGNAPGPAASPVIASANPVEQLWHCPMHPSYVSSHPGNCPICGMKLVPISPPPSAAVPSLSGFATVEIDAQRQQLIGMRAVVAQKREFSEPLRLSGRVTFDETRVHHIHTRYEAYVEEIYADFVGKYVKQGEPLLALYSPDLLSAEQEYLLALGAGRALHPGTQEAAITGAVDQDLVSSARERLLLWNVSPGDIRTLERSGRPSRTLKIYAPSSGYVIAKTAVHGMRVKPEDSLFDIVDLSHMWVVADLHEFELPRVAMGQLATITVPYWPERKWEGRVTYIFPSVDPKTRTVRVRLDVANPRGELLAEMFADVLLQVAPRRALVIAEDCIIETGTRKIVFVLLAEGRLEPREITTGSHAEHQVEVLSGLQEGERVASGASFLLDSESRLQSAISAMGGK